MFLKYNLFTIIWIILIQLLTMMPGQSMPETDIWGLLSFDKIAHAFFFAVLVFLTIVGFTKQHTYKRLRYNAERNAIIFAVIYGLFIEMMQSLIPGRSIEFYDLLADVFGCFTGWGTFYLIYKT